MPALATYWAFMSQLSSTPSDNIIHYTLSPATACQHIWVVMIIPSGQNQVDSTGNLGMVDTWWRGTPGEIWVVIVMRIHVETEGKIGEGFSRGSVENL